MWSVVFQLFVLIELTLSNVTALKLGIGKKWFLPDPDGKSEGRLNLDVIPNQTNVNGPCFQRNQKLNASIQEGNESAYDCTQNGLYKAEQCNRSGCFCVDRKSGKTIEGTYQGGRGWEWESRCKFGPPCFEKNLDIQESGDVKSLLDCTAEGFYKPLLCGTHRCRCIHPETGGWYAGTNWVQDGTKLNCKSNVTGPCIEDYKGVQETMRQGETADLNPPSCTDDGFYYPKQCIWVGCECVDPKTGRSIEGTFRENDEPPVKCNVIAQCEHSVLMITFAVTAFCISG